LDEQNPKTKVIYGKKELKKGKINNIPYKEQEYVDIL
jgi:hypothetical protein